MPCFFTLKDLSTEQQQLFSVVDSAERPMFLASVKARQLKHHSIPATIKKIWNIRLFLSLVSKTARTLFPSSRETTPLVTQLSDSNEVKNF